MTYSANADASRTICVRLAPRAGSQPRTGQVLNRAATLAIRAVSSAIVGRSALFRSSASAYSDRLWPAAAARDLRMRCTSSGTSRICKLAMQNLDMHNACLYDDARVCSMTRLVPQFCNTLLGVPLRVRDSALKHGYDYETISHAIDMALTIIEIDPDADPPKLLFIGPDSAGNLLEVIGGEYPNDVLLIWHADACRVKYRMLLPKPGGAA